MARSPEKKPDPGQSAREANRLKGLISRKQKAVAHKDVWQSLFDDIHQFILPYRRTEEGERGTSRKSRLYDSTAVVSAFRFAGRIQRELTPVNEEWAKIIPGPAIEEKDVEGLSAALQRPNAIMMSLIDTGEFHTASHEMYMDLSAGTGVLLVLEGDDEEPVRYESVPLAEVYLDSGGGNKVKGMFWPRKWSPCDIKDKWPEAEAKITDEPLKKRFEESCTNPDVEVLQCVYFDAKAKSQAKRWVYEAILVHGEDAPIGLKQTKSRFSPAIIPRYLKLPGEIYGRGPAMFALPNAKVANKTVELILQAAALSVFGMFTVTDEDILDPAKAVIEPGALWHVASNATGAYGGRSVEQIKLPNDFNITDIVLQEQREQVKKALLDDQLPPMSGAVRSPTEIVERQANLETDAAGAFGRLTSEFAIALYNRVMEIAVNKNLIDKGLWIDGRARKLQLLGVMSDAQNLQKLQKLVRALELALSLGGPELMMLTYKVEDIFVVVGQLLGVEPHLMRSKLDRKKLQELVAQIIAAQQMPAEGEAQDAAA